MGVGAVFLSKPLGTEASLVGCFPVLYFRQWIDEEQMSHGMYLQVSGVIFAPSRSLRITSDRALHVKVLQLYALPTACGSRDTWCQIASQGPYADLHIYIQ